MVERNGDPVARLVPLPDAAGGSLREGLAAWSTGGGGEPDPDFADVLERVGAADRPPDDARGS